MIFLPSSWIQSTRQPCAGQHSIMDQSSESICWETKMTRCMEVALLIIIIPEVIKGQRKKMTRGLKHQGIGAQLFFSAMLYLCDFWQFHASVTPFPTCSTEVIVSSFPLLTFIIWTTSSRCQGMTT